MHRFRIAPDWIATAVPIGLGAALAVVACAPLFANAGFLLTRGAGDSANLLFRVHQLLAAYAGGAFPARWMPDAAYGYGLPYFTYYASFSTHVAAWFKLTGFDYPTAIKLAQVTAIAVGAWAVFGWLSAFEPKRADTSWRLASRPLAGAIAYTFAPFHLVNIYARGDSLAELWALALTPLALWAVERFGAGRSLGRAAALAAVIAAVVCTHNVSALMTLPFIGAYAGLRLALGDTSTRVARLAQGLATAVWGLALAAFFWAPALAEADAVQLSALTNGYFSYAGHFRSADLVQLGWFFNYSGNAFAMGTAQTLAALAGLLALLIRRERLTWRHVFMLSGLVAGTFLITPAAAPLYATLPGLAYVQFPWRFLGVQALFTAALTSWLWPAGADLDLRLRPGSRVAAGCMLVLGVLLAVQALVGLRLEFVPLADEEITAGRLNLFEQATSMIGNTANAEYLPTAVDPRPWTSPALIGRAPQPVALAGTATGTRLGQTSSRQTWSVSADGPAAVALPTYWWPGWEARVDGVPVVTRAADGLGFIAFDVPDGTHTVTLALTDTPVRAAANGISLLAIAILPLLVALQRRRNRRGGSLPAGGRAALAVLLAVVVIPLPGALVQRDAGADRSADWDVVPRAWRGLEAREALPLNVDAVVPAFPHRDAVRFANGAELIGVRQTPTRPQAGANVHVQLDWRQAYPAIVTLTLWPPSAPVDDTAAPLMTVTAPVSVLATAAERSRVEVDLTLPASLAPGVYWWSVDLAGDGGPAAAVTATGRGRGRVFLSPFVIDGATAAPAETLADLGPLRLHGVTARVREGRAVIDAVWSAMRPVGEDLAVSLRLFDPAGARVDQRDAQPGGGFSPTHTWVPGQALSDAVSLALPADPVAGSYRLDVVVYHPSTLEPVGTASTTVVIAPFTARAAAAPVWELSSTLGLAGVDLPASVEAGTPLAFVAHWLTGAPAPTGQARWALVAPDGREVVTLTDALPGPAGWPASAALKAQVVLAVPPDLAAGDYAVQARLGDGPIVAAGTVAVTASTRSFTLPPLQQTVGAVFGDQITLAGYDLASSGTALRLTLVFQALRAPAANYKYFVHVLEPATGAVVAQADAEPGGNLHPTSAWLAGEVVSEPVTIDLSGVAPGRYQIAVGWYDPAQGGAPRLVAVDASGARAADDRILLTDLVERP